ncbi:hypothetical protein ASF12_22730 [Paenibacillus sp. Leaf72]|nr:hypothetical protein ASF12_22730 [Paenibacillus sp. Leaf72]
MHLLVVDNDNLNLESFYHAVEKIEVVVTLNCMALCVFIISQGNTLSEVDNWLLIVYFQKRLLYRFSIKMLKPRYI